MKMTIKYPMPKKLNNPITKEVKKEKKSKYKNHKTIIDGIKFDSQKESNRYLLLKDKIKHNEISDLRLQVKFELQPSYVINGRTIRAINYIADFVYNESGKDIIEDTKGFRTEVYKLKKKMFEYKYGFEIREI